MLLYAIVGTFTDGFSLYRQGDAGTVFNSQPTGLAVDAAGQAFAAASAPADYDGNRRSDIAIFRPSSGVWWIRYRQATSRPTARSHRALPATWRYPAITTATAFAVPANFRAGVDVFSLPLGLAYMPASGLIPVGEK